MHLLDKKDLNAFLGKEGAWTQKRLIGRLSYLSGVPPFDEALGGVSFADTVALLNLVVRPKGLQVEMMKGLTYYRIGIPMEDIQAVTLEDKQRITETKEKSVVGRALLGGLLLGPVGAIVGGLSGVGSKEVNANAPDIFVSIEHTTDNKKGLILLSANHKDRDEIVRFMDKHLPRFSVSKSQPPTAGGNQENTTIEKLERLGGLKERGLITDAEFSKMKEELLRGQ